MSIDYVIHDEDIIQPTELSSPRSIYFYIDKEDGEEDVDLLTSAAIWLSQHKDDYTTILSISFQYFQEEEPGVSLLLVVE